MPFQSLSEAGCHLCHIHPFSTGLLKKLSDFLHFPSLEVPLKDLREDGTCRFWGNANFKKGGHRAHKALSNLRT